MKSNLIIWANCQGNALVLMLNKYYADKFNIFCFANYTYIKDNTPLPEIFNTCDIFLYQNYSNSDEQFCMKHIINNILPPNSIKVSFPTLHRNNLQFCYEVNSPENINTICPSFPHGEFYFGIHNIRDFVTNLQKEGLNETDILTKTVEVINTQDFITNDQIIHHETTSLDFLRSKSLTSDIPNIYNFIINNYKCIRLWHNPNHPNGVLLNELCKEIFIKLGLIYPNNEENVILLDGALKDWKMPILKSIYNYYNITQIDNNCSSWYHADIFDETSYITKYVKFIINTNSIQI